MLDQITLQSLGRESTLEDAWNNWDGFVVGAKGELSKPGKIGLVEGSSVDPWQFARHHATVGEVGDLGCYFLRDVTYAGVAYPFLNGNLLDDGSHLSRVSAVWLANFPQHRPGGSENTPPRLIETPIISVAGPGHQTYGHWIIDFLPRLAIAKLVLGEHFAKFKFLLLSDTPDWGKALLKRFLGIEDHQLIVFEFARDEFVCERLCYPTYAHSYPFFLHTFLRDFYREQAYGAYGNRRLCIQRRSHRSGRIFLQRGVFENMAQAEGFELVDPQDLSIDEQIALFRSAAVVIGEYGSALHNSVFCSETTVFGVLNAPGVEQTRLCAVFGQSIIFAVGLDDEGAWTMSVEQLECFFEAVRDAAYRPEYNASHSTVPTANSFPAIADLVREHRWEILNANPNMSPVELHLGSDGSILTCMELDAVTWAISSNQLAFLNEQRDVTTSFQERLDIGRDVLLSGRSARGTGALCVRSSPRQAMPSSVEMRIGAFTQGHEGIVNPRSIALSVGKFCSIAGSVAITDFDYDGRAVSNYRFETSDNAHQSGATAGMTRRGVEIGHDVCIEYGVTLRAGVRVGHGAMILAGAVVSNDVPDYAVVEGNPGAVVAFRFTSEQIHRLVSVQWWDMPMDKLRPLLPLLASHDVEAFLRIAIG